MPTLPPVPQQATRSPRGRANPSCQFFHQQAQAAGSREGILQYAEWGSSSKEPVIQRWTGNPPSLPQSSRGEQHQGTVKPERIFAVKVPRNTASSGAAGNFMPASWPHLLWCLGLLCFSAAVLTWAGQRKPATLVTEVASWNSSFRKVSFSATGFQHGPVSNTKQQCFSNAIIIPTFPSTQISALPLYTSIPPL